MTVPAPIVYLMAAATFLACKVVTFLPHRFAVALLTLVHADSLREHCYVFYGGSRERQWVRELGESLGE